MRSLVPKIKTHSCLKEYNLKPRYTIAEYLKVQGRKALTDKEKIDFGLPKPLPDNWLGLDMLTLLENKKNPPPKPERTGIIAKDKKKLRRKDRQQKRRIARERKALAGKVQALAPEGTPKTPASEFYRSDAWRQLRYEVLRLYGGECALCGRSKRLHGVMIHVDHIVPRSLNPSLELEMSNLQLLCEDCNKGKSNFDTTDWR